MKATIDSGGRILVPKALRERFGLEPGATVDISPYGAGLQITPGDRTARLARDSHGHLVIDGEHELSDAELFALIDAGRR